MCLDPGTLGMVASLASGALQAVASIQAGNAAYVAGMQNAQIAERNAQAVEEEKKNVQDAAAIERRRLGEQVRAARGELFAKYGHMGLDPNIGTPADLVGDVSRAYDIDRSILGRNEITELGRLDKSQADYRTQAGMYRSEAKSARTSGFLGAASSVLGTVSSVSDNWIKQPSSSLGAASSVLGAASSVLGTVSSVSDNWIRQPSSSYSLSAARAAQTAVRIGG